MLWQPALPEKYLALSDEELARAIEARRAQLGDDLLILGHHYQQDDVIRHADLTGDSLMLSQLAHEEATKRGTKYIVFCGVHFMAETADILTDDSVHVMLPDLSAGCSMADMADYEDVLDAWEMIGEAVGCRPSALGKKPTAESRKQTALCRVIPITYVNSSAAVKAFVGDHGGACCTSSNAHHVFEWALQGGTEPIAPGEEIKILFLPDQHLGRNTASKFGLRTEVDEAQGRGPSQTIVWEPKQEHGGTTAANIREARVILWAGHCSVHKLFRPEHVDELRAEYAERGGINVLVHPECCKEVVDKADLNGSTEFIIRTIRDSVQGTNWAIGTEVHLVNRLAREHAARGVHVRTLSSCQCLCTTMYRIDPQHLLWILDHLVAGEVLNEIRVHPDAAQSAKLALDRMLQLVAPELRTAALVD